MATQRIFGAKWKQPELVQTLMMIRDKGHDGFYAGPVAEEIERYMKANGGLITREDLSRYQAIEREPVKGKYKGFDIYSMGPPSSGGTAILEMVSMLEFAGMDSVEFGSATYVHLLAEVMRRAYADRAEFLGDIDFDSQMPITELLSKEHARKRFTSVDFHQASPSDSSRFGQIYEGDHTTHFSIIDKHGNAVSLTYTIEHAYGSGMGSPKLGFIFNNEMGDFNPIPGYTNSIGYIGSLPNQIEPEKRMLSSMSPTIVAKDGKPYLIIGSPGGRTIINTVFQTVLAVLEYEMQVDRAIEALKIHHQWLPDVIRYEEDRLSPDTRKILESMGHELSPVSALGVLMGIQVDMENEVYIGAADSRSASGAALGY
jgi:gamma-glutamyltranspeptidase/glutathione hydrolase